MAAAEKKDAEIGQMTAIGQMSAQRPAVQVPTIGVQVATRIGDIATIELQTFLERDAPYAEQNAVIDKLTRLAMRQAAFHQLPGLQDDLDRANREKEVAVANMTDNRRTWAAQKEALEKEFEHAEAEYVTHLDAAEQAWRRTNREGPYTPKGATKSNLEQMSAQQIGIQDRLKQLDQDVTSQERAHTQALEYHRKAVAKVQAKIDEAKARIDGTDG
jgi:peptidoglycan hydrolase CwlO-like protein